MHPTWSFAYIERQTRTNNAKPHRHHGPQQVAWSIFGDFFTSCLDQDFWLRLPQKYFFFQADIYFLIMWLLYEEMVI